MSRVTLVMMMALSTVALSACKKDGGSAGSTAAKGSGSWTAKVSAGNELFVTMETSLGTIVVKLFSKDAPKTVANFVGLATGEREWRNPQGETVKGKPLYVGTTFHRVITDFMIQGGDPLGNGTGDPGYRFEDEFQSGRTFTKPGLLAMANSGPNTNGSQFFITTSVPAWLNNRHTIFGEVVKGYEVVLAISKVPKGAMDKPQTPVTINAMTMSDTQP